MEVTFLGHAQLLVRAAGQVVLCDPWFAEPVFAYSWWRYPPPPFPTAASVGRIDRLLLSHLHPDHSGPGTLAQIDPGTPTYALPFPSGALARRLDAAKYREVTWLAAWQTVEVAPGLRVTMVPHDGGWEVASMVIEAEGIRLYHGNDNPLEVKTYQEIVARLGPIDLAFLPFAGASSYPTCFSWDRATMLEKAAGKKREGIARLTDGITGLKPRIAVPFASSWALLEESELWKNFIDRPTPDEAAAAVTDAARAAGSEVLVLEPGDEWAPATGVVRKGRVTGWLYDQPSVRRYAEQERARVDRALGARARHDRGLPDAARLDRTFRAYFTEMLAETCSSTGKLTMVAGFVAEGAPGGAWHAVFSPGQPPRINAGASDQADEIFTVSTAELWDVLTSPSRWEDLWYGYRLRVAKRPGAGYYRAFWDMLLNFDDEALSRRLDGMEGAATDA